MPPSHSTTLPVLSATLDACVSETLLASPVAADVVAFVFVPVPVPVLASPAAVLVDASFDSLKHATIAKPKSASQRGMA
jgi:hypothetical protein